MTTLPSWHQALLSSCGQRERRCSTDSMMKESSHYSKSNQSSPRVVICNVQGTFPCNILKAAKQHKAAPWRLICEHQLPKI